MQRTLLINSDLISYFLYLIECVANSTRRLAYVRGPNAVANAAGKFTRQSQTRERSELDSYPTRCTQGPHDDVTELAACFLTFHTFPQQLLFLCSPLPLYIFYSARGVRMLRW